VLLLINRYVPIALTMLAPIIVNILLFHGLMNLDGLGLALLVTILWAVVFASVHSAFAGIFQARVETTPASVPRRTRVISPA
jgi:putative oxidoreductase